MVGTQTPVPTVPVAPVLQTAAASGHMPSGPIKQGVPCIFFQKGYCLKGDWCPFVHGPNPLSNKASFIPEAASAEPATSNKAFIGADKFTQEKKVGPNDVAKPMKVPFQTKSCIEVERAPPRMEAIKWRTPQASVHELPELKNAGAVGNGYPRVQQPRLLDEPGSMNNKDAEEVSREPSPGFDVLVDDERRDGYYPSEDQYGMSREHETGNNYETGHSSDYNRISDIANERYQDTLAYGSHDRFRDQYAWEHGASSERKQGCSFNERRPYSRTDSRGQVDELDLRHRLSKNKRANGLRSVINHEHARDRHSEDRRHQGSRRDEQHFPRQENSVSSRLRGRIRLPGRSSSPTDKDDIVRSNDRRRSSPVKPILSSQQGWVLDRIKGRGEDSYTNGGKSYRGMHPRRDALNDESANFAGPKSLSELKNKKNGDRGGYPLMDQQLLGKRKHLMPEEHKTSGDDASFEGPKPLQEILKRKRGATVVSANGGSTSNNGSVEGSTQNEMEKSVSAEKTEEQTVGSKILAEDSVPIEDGEYQEYEAYEEEGGEYDYEQVDGEGYEMYEGENGDMEGEEEYQGEEEEVEFEKNMEVVYPIQE